MSKRSHDLLPIHLLTRSQDHNQFVSVQQYKMYMTNNALQVFFQQHPQNSIESGEFVQPTNLPIPKPSTIMQPKEGKSSAKKNQALQWTLPFFI